MEIRTSAIFGRSFFTCGRSRMIRFTSRQARCPLNRIYKHALESAIRGEGSVPARKSYSQIIQVRTNHIIWLAYVQQSSDDAGSRGTVDNHAAQEAAVWLCLSGVCRGEFTGSHRQQKGLLSVVCVCSGQGMAHGREAKDKQGRA
jgi:hypothetical protein